MQAKWNQTQVKSGGCRRNGNRRFMVVPWRSTKGVEPDAVKAASPVLNGGDEETYPQATRLVPTQRGYSPHLKRGVRLPWSLVAKEYEYGADNIRRNRSRT